jgi:hypothetical protein
LQPQSQTVPFVGFAESEILGSRPNLSAGHEDSLKTPFRPDAPCERQQPPNLEASTGPAPTQTPVSSASASTSVPAPLEQLGSHALNYMKDYTQAQRLSAQGKDTQATALTKQAALEWLRYQASSEPALKAEIKKLESGGSK